MNRQYSAWLCTDPNVLAGQHCDITVLADTPTLAEAGEDGPSLPVWHSNGPPLFHSELAITCDALDFTPALQLAQTALLAAGWRPTFGAQWAPVGTGCMITVERDTR